MQINIRCILAVGDSPNNKWRAVSERLGAQLANGNERQKG